jgi:hypothetical protein
MRLFGGKSTLRIVTIPHEYRNEEHGNDEEHLAKLQHHLRCNVIWVECFLLLLRGSDLQIEW